MSMYEKDDFYGKYNAPSAPPLPPPHHTSSSMAEYHRSSSTTTSVTSNAVKTPSPPPAHGYPASPFDSPSTKRNSLDDPDMYHHVPMVGGYQQSRASMSDTRLTSASAMPAGYNKTAQYDSDDDDEEKRHMMTIPVRERRKQSCMDKLCCGCCTCCPRWARYCSCIFLLLLVGAGIAVGVLAALFKMPQVHMSGLDGQPAVNVTNGNQINMAFQLQVSVDNPNVEGITFDSIVAKAYYPNHHDVQLGGGEKDQVVIGKNQVTNFTFPFQLMIDMGNPQYQSIVDDLFSRCGLYGAPKQQIKVDYDVIPTVKFGIIPISLTISNSASFDCPDVLTHLGTLAGATGSASEGAAAASLSAGLSPTPS